MTAAAPLAKGAGEGSDPHRIHGRRLAGVRQEENYDIGVTIWRKSASIP